MIFSRNTTAARSLPGGLVLRPDGIAEVRIEDDHTCTVAEARMLARRIRALGGGRPVALLRIAGEHAQIEDGVREYTASPEVQESILADAIVVRSLAQRILGNFYLKTNRPEKPTQLFSTVEEAEQWLKTLMC